MGWLWLLPWVCLRICWEQHFFILHLSCGRVTCFSRGRLCSSSVLAICRREIAVRFQLILFFCWKRHKNLFSFSLKVSGAVSYPLPVIEIKSSNGSKPGVDWKALEGEAAGEMRSSLEQLATLLPCGLLDTHHHFFHLSGLRHEVLPMESGFWGRQLLAASPFPPAAWGRRAEVCQQPAGREMAAISRWVRGGCVGWDSFSGAWRLAGLASKASLDVRRRRTTLT